MQPNSTGELRTWQHCSISNCPALYHQSSDSNQRRQVEDMKEREWKRGQMRVAHLSVTVRSSLRPPVPSFPCPPSFPFNSHQWIHTSAHSRTCKQAFTHLYMQISGGCCFSRVKKQHHLSMSECVLRFTFFWCL